MSNGSGSINNLRKKVTKTHELIAVSYHESGHTIYGLLHFMKIGSVTVFNNSKSSRGEGTTNYEAVFEESTEDMTLFNYWLKSEIGLCYAGNCAERYYFKSISGSDKFPKFLKDGSEDDISEASEFIRKYNLAPAGKKRYAFKQKMIKDCSNILEQYWDDVTLVSHSLFNKKRLYYSDLKSLLCKNSKNKSFWKEQFKLIDYISDNYGNVDNKKLKSIMSL
jgi:hypothetical protein